MNVQSHSGKVGSGDFTFFKKFCERKNIAPYEVQPGPKRVPFPEKISGRAGEKVLGPFGQAA